MNSFVDEDAGAADDNDDDEEDGTRTAAINADRMPFWW